MRLIADLHIHSKYSRATSPKMNLVEMAQWARWKGIDIVSTGDFTHPAHFAAIEELLEPAEDGLFMLKGEDKKQDTLRPLRFILTTEVSNIFKQGERTRKIHNLIFVPSIDVAKSIKTTLGAIGNIGSDGRPIFGFSAKDLIKIVLEASPHAMLVPAHAWTPWFSIFGSRSGFNSIEECFGEYAPHIHAIETGLSSNPAMNWRLSALDNITLISNSDAHSPSKLGREANVFECAPSYGNIMDIIKTKDRERFLFTIEFFPEEGKYHADGHRNCGVLFGPDETIKAGGLCPVCGKGLTVGVLSRVQELADRPEGFVPENAIPSRHIIPLVEILSEAMGFGVASKRVQSEYMRIISEGGDEFHILLDMSEGDLIGLAGERAAGAIIKMRRGEVNITPGFDGEFGKINILGKREKVTPQGPAQTNLFV
ncbi:MAG: endonuclease Q family protein [Thermodesulfobacteriota bacterium]